MQTAPFYRHLFDTRVGTYYTKHSHHAILAQTCTSFSLVVSRKHYYRPESPDVVVLGPGWPRLGHSLSDPRSVAKNGGARTCHASRSSKFACLQVGNGCGSEDRRKDVWCSLDHRLSVVEALLRGEKDSYRRRALKPKSSSCEGKGRTGNVRSTLYRISSRQSHLRQTCRQGRAERE